VPALVSLLLELSFSPHLCGQLLDAQVLLMLAQLLQQEAAGGMSSMLVTQVGVGASHDDTPVFATRQLHLTPSVCSSAPAAVMSVCQLDSVYSKDSN
jgi:hypothetical protein